MKEMNKCAIGGYVLLLGLLAGQMAGAADLTIPLGSAATVTKKVVRYSCDANAAKLGVPAGTFSVEYLNGGGNSLAVVPILGNPTVFVNVASGSGARYVAQQFTWWEAHNAVMFSSDRPQGKVESECRPVAREIPTKGP
jgi:membrane-bound inhibitor of C-type lysozyme